MVLTPLKVSFGIGAAALDWFQSYLTSRVECMRHGSARSTHKTAVWRATGIYNATLAGLPASQLSRLQSVLNAAARLIHRSSQYEHVTPILPDLHWLRSPERIDFKLAVLTYRCLHGLAPRYLSDYIQRVAISNHRRLWSSSSSQLVIQCTRLLVIVHFWLPDAASGKSAARRHLSFNAVCFSKPSQNSTLFPITSFLTVFQFLVLHTVYSSGLAVFVV